MPHANIMLVNDSVGYPRLFKRLDESRYGFLGGASLPMSR